MRRKTVRGRLMHVRHLGSLTGKTIFQHVSAATGGDIHVGDRGCKQNALRTARISCKQQSLNSEDLAFGSMPCYTHFVRQRSF